MINAETRGLTINGRNCKIVYPEFEKIDENLKKKTKID
jgi:hypothetical protein